MYPLVLPQERGCPTKSCPRCGSSNFKRNGFFSRKEDKKQWNNNGNWPNEPL